MKVQITMTLNEVIFGARQLEEHSGRVFVACFGFLCDFFLNHERLEPKFVTAIDEQLWCD
jgi:hypothetical protein